MAIDVYAALNLHQNPIEEFAFEEGPTFPINPVPAQPFFSTADATLYVWNGSAWVSLFQGTSKFAATIGDGAALVYTVTHNLGTLDTIESVYSVSTGIEEIAVITHATTNTTTFTFTVAPALNSVRVVIHA